MFFFSKDKKKEQCGCGCSGPEYIMYVPENFKFKDI